MLLWYIGIILIAFLFGIFDIPLSILFTVIVAYIVLTIPFVMPILAGRDTEKMMNYLKKSRNKYFQFLFHFLREDSAAAEQVVGTMRAGKTKDMATVMLLIKQKQYKEADSILDGLKESLFRNYYKAAAALAEGNDAEYTACREKIKDADYRKWLDIEEMAMSGKKEEALAAVEEQIKKLRGMKLLSAVHYRSELKERSE